MKSKILFIVGPTAVGKSDVAYQLAGQMHGEIISCDSMQIYKEINIASNKPPKDILEDIAHHLVNILSVTEEFDVARFNKMANDAINDIHNRGRVPVIVGGSGMYMQILLDGIFKGGVKNEALRKDLKEQAKQYGNQFLYEKLKTADPKAAVKIHPNDVRRVVRALEIWFTEQIPISEMQKDREGLWGKYDITLFALDRERRQLYDRIDRRADQMFEEGIVDEVRSVSEEHWSKTAGKIIGIQEIKGFLRGEYGEQEAVERIKLNTRHLAKRQMTWFRREKRLNWILIEPQDPPQRTARLIMDECETKEKIGQL